jgi:hypothetical protein
MRGLKIYRVATDVMDRLNLMIMQNYLVGEEVSRGLHWFE